MSKITNNDLNRSGMQLYPYGNSGRRRVNDSATRHYWPTALLCYLIGSQILLQISNVPRL